MTKQEQQSLFKSGTFLNKAGKLFSDPKSMSPTQIVQLLKMAGLEVPKGVSVGADVAQIYIAGGAMTSLGSNASIGAYAGPAAAIMGAAMDLMGQAGLIDMKSQGAQAINIGIDLAMIIGSCGTNVVADVKFVLDVIASAEIPDAQRMAEGYAKANLSQFVQNYTKPEKLALAKNFAAYQSGTISSFDLMTLVAQESPDFFYNYYPQLQTFIPPMLLTLKSTVSTETSNIYGAIDEGLASASKTFLTVGGTLVERTSKIWNYVVPQILAKYRMLDAQSKSRACFKMKTLAALSMFPPYIDTFAENWNPFTIMKNLDITFSDLGESQIIPNLIDQTLGVYVPPKVIINGQAMVDPKQQAIYLEKQRLNNVYTQQHANVLKYDEMGDYRNMVKNLDPKSAKFIIENASPVWVDYTADPRDVAEQKKISPSLRSVRNYWSALHFWESVKDNPIYASIAPLVHEYDFFPSIKEIDDLARDLNFKITGRALNKLAYQKIATIMGVTPDKLYIRNVDEIGKQPAIFGTK